MSKKLFKVDETDSEIRVDAYLSGMFSDYSRTKLQDLIKSKKVLVNHKPCKPSLIVHIDDEIICDITELESPIIAQNIPIDIVWEDDNYAIVNKPSGMLTHPTSKDKSGTLVNALLFKYGDNLSDINGDYRRGIVHRLDRFTSGLLIIAKNNDAHEKMAEMIKNREIEKRYRTIVKGRLTGNITINEPIGRSKTNPAKMCTTPDGKPSLTEISLIEQFDDATYLDVNLKTGRTHQIRVHLSSINHPVFNDTLYGFGKMKIKTDEQVLQSYKLRFTEPYTKKEITVEIEPDEKLKKVLYYLRQKGNNNE